MEIFLEISLIIVIATAISGVVKILKQPLIIGYILTGLLIGPYALNLLQSPDFFEIFSQFGIALLLFIVGLNLSPNVIREVGKVAIITGVGQVLFTSIVGYAIAIGLGFSTIHAAYIAVGLTFSSTIIILKLLSDKGDLDTLYGKIAVGFLLVQDIIASIILIVISASSLGSGPLDITFQILWKGIVLFGTLYFFAKYVLPQVMQFFAKSQEFLFLFSLAWGFGIASLFDSFGFSIEIGALTAGVALSLFPYHYEISAKMRPLRDFFLIIFFILLGSQLAPESVSLMLIPALIMSAFVLIGNPLIVMGLMGAMGYPKRVSFMSGLTVAQISEFSLVLIAIGVGVGHLNENILGLMTLVGLITIAGSSYLIMYSEKIYPKLAGALQIFERKNLKRVRNKHANYDAMLFGYNRIGYDFLETFKELKYKYLVVDFDPEITSLLTNNKIPNEYGDVGDSDFLDELNLKDAKMIISTIPDFETNAFLIEKVKKVNPDAIVMAVSHNIQDAHLLYESDADYVIMPHFLGGRYASNLVRKHGLRPEKFKHERKKHKKNLAERVVLGHEHPSTNQ